MCQTLYMDALYEEKILKSSDCHRMSAKLLQKIKNTKIPVMPTKCVFCNGLWIKIFSRRLISNFLKWNDYGQRVSRRPPHLHSLPVSVFSRPVSHNPCSSEPLKPSQPTQGSTANCHLIFLQLAIF